MEERKVVVPLTKTVNRVTLEQADFAIISAAHSLITEGFDVTGEDRDLVRLVLTGQQTERQFRETIKTKYNV